MSHKPGNAHKIKTSHVDQSTLRLEQQCHDHGYGEDSLPPRDRLLPRIFGVIMIILGAMNCMLAWRGSFHLSEFYLALIGLGLALYCFGAIRASSKES